MMTNHDVQDGCVGTCSGVWITGIALARPVTIDERTSGHWYTVHVNTTPSSVSCYQVLLLHCLHYTHTHSMVYY